MATQELWLRIEQLKQRVINYEENKHLNVDGEIRPTRWDWLESCLREIARLLDERDQKGA